MKYQLDDKHGNKLIIGDGRTTDVYLSLVGQPIMRKIARYDYVKKRLYVTRDSKKHFHFASKSYGINHALLTNLLIEQVHFIIDGKHYLIPHEVVIANGSFLNFQKEGFELQIFLPFETILKYAM